MTDLNNLSENELQALLENAEKTLKERQANKRKEVFTQIRELAASIGVSVDIHETDARKGERKVNKVAARYRNPENALQTWSGRGLAPKWMQAYIDAGREKSEFEI
jgi:DNA-binding protein H-NS